MKESNYEDIIHLSHFEPKNHLRMCRYNRAAQFAPFAALTGYEEQIKETTRLTHKKIEIDDEFKEILNYKLNRLNEIVRLRPEVEITYFVPDDKKDGGEYVIEKGNIKSIDFINRFIKFTNNKKIMIDEIMNIESVQLRIDL